MNRKGQVTIFVVLGIVIVAIMVVGFFLREQISDVVQGQKIIEEITLSQDVKELRDDVEYCLEDSFKDSLILVASRGGYYQIPKNTIGYYGYSVPLYLDKKKENVPDLTDIENSVAKSLESRIQLCNIGKAVAETVPVAEVEIKENKAETELYYPITLEGSRIENFRAEVETDFLQDYEKVLQLYEKQKNIVGMLAIGELALLAEEKDYILHIDSAQDAMLYFLTFNHTLLNNEALAFSFAIRNPSEE